jgi:hypothetical protein
LKPVGTTDGMKARGKYRDFVHDMVTRASKLFEKTIERDAKHKKNMAKRFLFLKSIKRILRFHLCSSVANNVWVS